MNCGKILFFLLFVSLIFFLVYVQIEKIRRKNQKFLDRTMDRIYEQDRRDNLGISLLFGGTLACGDRVKVKNESANLKKGLI